MALSVCREATGFPESQARRGSLRYAALSLLKTSTHLGIQRLLLGWVIFLGGLIPLLWLHTFSDRAAHRAIGPLFLLLWIALLVCVWDGCKLFTPRLRFIFFLVQVTASVVVCMLFFLHLIS